VNIVRINDRYFFQVFFSNSKQLIKSAPYRFSVQKTFIEYFIDFLPEGVLLHTNGIVVSANLKAAASLGYDDVDSIRNINLFDFLHPDFVATAKIRLKTLSSGLNVPFFTYKIYDKEKKNILEIDVKSYPLLLFSDNMVLMILIDKKHDAYGERDKDSDFINNLLQNEIVDRIKVQTRLQQTQQYLNSIINSSLDIIIASDKNSLITEFNKAAQNVFGYSRDEVIGKPVSILYGNNSIYKKVQRSILQTGIYSDEILNKKKDGTRFTSFLNLAEMCDEFNDPIGRVGVSRDISLFKQQQDALINSELRYRNLFENTSDLLFSFLIDGTLVYYNKSFFDLLGYSDKELVGLGFLHLVHPNSISYLFNLLHSSSKDKLYNVEITLVKKSKKYLRRSVGNVSRRDAKIAENGES
jgi:PAS domain S-box-containing protein